MTVLYPKRFQQAAPAGFDGVFDWDFLEGCFPRATIMPMDFDCVVEINGNFLVFETKADGKAVPRGQILTFISLLQLPQFCLFLINGKTPESITKLSSYWCDRRKIISPANADIVREKAKRWAKYAEQNPQGRQFEILFP